jgi:hypothetical protein
MLSRPSRLRTRVCFLLPTAALLTLCLLAAGPAAGASASTFTRGFADSVWVWPDNTTQTARQWARNVHASGARIAEVEVDWVSYEPNAPAGGAYPTNPANPAYSGWSTLDTTVKTLESAGVKPMLLITDAPGWAEAGGVANPHTQGYEPNASALGAFGQALATRYDGSYPDPSSPGTALPRVTYYQLWAEANLTIKLAPEWTKVGGTWVDSGATLYRNMLNAFYGGVKAAAPSDQVVFSGLEAYGDAPGTPNGRVAPVTFLEDVLCLNSKLERVCDTPAHFDILASDPYDIGSPATHAYSRTDASAPDLRKLTRVVNAARRAGTALPDVNKPLWVTEFGYDSDPPNPSGLPAAKQARWLEQSLYVFWNEGVSTVFWYLIRDQPGHNYAVDYFSGIYFYNGTKKVSYTAYRFPLVIASYDGRARFWGIAPTSGRVAVELLTSSGWRVVATANRKAGSVFSGLLANDVKGSYRAVEGSAASLPWSY